MLPEHDYAHSTKVQCRPDDQLTKTFDNSHYCDVNMSAMASEITSVSIVYSTVCSGADQRKHQRSTSLAFVWRIHRWPVCKEFDLDNRINTLGPRKNGRHFADDILKCIFLNENAGILPKISLKFVPKVRINNIPALVQIMAWRRPGDKSSSEPMMVSLLTYICVTRPHWTNAMDMASAGSLTPPWDACKYNWIFVRYHVNLLFIGADGPSLSWWLHISSWHPV